MEFTQHRSHTLAGYERSLKGGSLNFTFREPVCEWQPSGTSAVALWKAIFGVWFGGRHHLWVFGARKKCVCSRGRSWSRSKGTMSLLTLRYAPITIDQVFASVWPSGHLHVTLGRDHGDPPTVAEAEREQTKRPKYFNKAAEALN